MRKLLVVTLLVALLGSGAAMAGPVTDTVKEIFVAKLPWMKEVAMDKIKDLIKSGGIKNLPGYEQVLLTGLAAVANAPFDSGHYAVLKEAATKAKELCKDRPLVGKLLDESIQASDALKNFENACKSLAGGIGYAATTKETSNTKAFLSLGITMYACVSSNKMGYLLLSHSWNPAMAAAKTENPSWFRALTFGNKSADSVQYFEDSCQILHTVANAVLEAQTNSMFRFCLESISSVRFQSLKDLIKVLSSGLAEYGAVVDSPSHKALSAYVVKVTGLINNEEMKGTFIVKSIAAMADVKGNTPAHKALLQLGFDMSAASPDNENQAYNLYTIARHACLQTEALPDAPAGVKAELAKAKANVDKGDHVKKWMEVLPIMRAGLKAALSKS